MDADPKIYRTVVFVRHGQYERNPEQLTRLGRKQANFTAKAVQYLKPSKLYASTMPRGIETANLIAERVNLTPIRKAFLCEGLLPGPKKFTAKWMKDIPSKEEKSQFKSKLRENQRRADLASKALFKAPTKGQDCHLIVAHGNVIRYWVCRALKIKTENWLSMDIVQASITTLRINNHGEIVLLGFSDCGHLPPKLRTYI